MNLRPPLHHSGSNSLCRAAKRVRGVAGGLSNQLHVADGQLFEQISQDTLGFESLPQPIVRRFFTRGLQRLNLRPQIIDHAVRGSGGEFFIASGEPLFKFRAVPSEL